MIKIDISHMSNSRVTDLLAWIHVLFLDSKGIQGLAEGRTKLNWLVKELTLQKFDFYRELNPLERIYNVFHLTLFCYIAQNGTSLFLHIPHIVDTYGIYVVVFIFIYGSISLFSVICYAEMAALMPSTGAAYHYCYYSMGEFVAFLTGWNIIFGQVLFVYFQCSHLKYFFDDVLFNNWIEENLTLPHYNFYDIIHLGGCFDIILPFITGVIAVFSTALVNKGKYICSGITCITICVLIIYSLIFAYYMDIHNPVKKKREGKAFPASSLVNAGYIFSGYEVISVLGEEAINPTESIPRSILISMKWSIFINVTWATQIALVWPGLIADTSWPMRAIMESINLPNLKWIGFIGFPLACIGSIYASFFLLIRVVYAMSRDGLICNIFSKLDRRTTTPFIPALMLALILSILGIVMKNDRYLFQPAFYSLIGTKILIYACLLYTRYECESSHGFGGFDTKDRWVLINFPRAQTKPTPVTHRISIKLIYLVVVSSFLLVQSLMTMRVHNLTHTVLKVTALIAGFFLIVSLFLLSRQPQNDRSNLMYSAPDVPFVPAVAMLSDFSVVFGEAMRPHLWLSLIIWWLIGIIFYCFYSFRNSTQRRMMNPDGTKWKIMDDRDEEFGTVLSLSRTRLHPSGEVSSITSEESMSSTGSKLQGKNVAEDSAQVVDEEEEVPAGEQSPGDAPTPPAQPLPGNTEEKT